MGFVAGGLLSLITFQLLANKEGDKLTTEARQVSEVSDTHKNKADRIVQERNLLLKETKAKDLEIAELKAKGDLAKVVEAQEIAIGLRDKTIESLNLENAELRTALEYKDKAYKIQLEATKVYQQALFEAKLKYGFGGSILGVAIGFLIPR